MEPSVFTKIINGELPCDKVYEDERTIAIIPLHPIGHGHVLVIPKVQVDQLMDLEPEDYQAVMDTVRKVGQHMRHVLDASRIGLQVIGLDVPHVHVHVIAFNTLEEYRELPDPHQKPDFAKNKALAERLRF